jgi:multimeric flavodoxin WrbA
MKKKLLIVANMPSPNTKQLAEAVLDGATNEEISEVESILLSPFDAVAEDILSCEAIILGTTENFGYMSGALKDFFDRTYNTCRKEKRGLPYSLFVRAGNDGTGAQRSVKSIITGLGWREVHPVVLCRGEFQESFTENCYNLGLYMAASLEAGII